MSESLRPLTVNLFLCFLCAVCAGLQTVNKTNQLWECCMESKIKGQGQFLVLWPRIIQAEYRFTIDFDGGKRLFIFASVTVIHTLGLVLCYTATCWYNLNKMTGVTRRKGKEKGKLGGLEPLIEATTPQTCTSWVFKTPSTLSAAGICPFDPADIVRAGFHL